MVTNQETIVRLTLFTLVSRKQRSGSELEYTEKLQQYSKFLRPARGRASAGSSGQARTVDQLIESIIQLPSEAGNH